MLFLCFDDWSFTTKIFWWGVLLVSMILGLPFRAEQAPWDHGLWLWRLLCIKHSKQGNNNQEWWDMCHVLGWWDFPLTNTVVIPVIFNKADRWLLVPLSCGVTWDAVPRPEQSWLLKAAAKPGLRSHWPGLCPLAWPIRLPVRVMAVCLLFPARLSVGCSVAAVYNIWPGQGLGGGRGNRVWVWLLWQDLKLPLSQTIIVCEHTEHKCKIKY